MKFLSALAALCLSTSAAVAAVTADGKLTPGQPGSVSVEPGFNAEAIDLTKPATVTADGAPVISGSLPPSVVPSQSATPVPETMGAAVVAAVGFLLMLRRRA